MHKRDMRGKWDFIDMINGGFACLADEVQVLDLQRRGQPPAPVPLLLDKQSMINNQYECNAQAHDCMLNLEVHVWMCEAIPFKWGILHLKCKFKPTFEFNMVDMNLFEQFESFKKCV